jgi:acetoin utilization protein AcuB
MSHLKVPVEEYTTPNPLTATEDISIDKLMQLMKSEGVRHIPITKGGAVVGIISERDLRVASALSPAQKSHICAREIMVREPVCVNSNDALEDVAFKMSEAKIGSVLVNDENDEFLGIFTVTDALNALIEIARMAEK